MRKPIHQFNFWHNVLQKYTQLYIYTFYDRVTVVGRDKIPTDKPVILAINHQNALMDALTVICSLKGPSVFMARADIFQSKTIAKILRFFKILPIFRIRDGIKNLQNNDVVFEEAVELLVDKGRLGILPEGNHFGERHLRVLKKGIARIAFQAEERKNFSLDIQVVPVGLDYTHYINFGADVLINFGDPISIADFKDQYQENAQKGMNAFMQELRERMIPQMLNIEDSEHYNEIETLKDIYIHHLLANRKLRDDHEHIVEKSQQIINQLIELKSREPETFNNLGKTALHIKDNIKELGLRYWVAAKKRHWFFEIIVNFFVLVVLFPVFIFGFVTNIIPFFIPVLASRKIKDPQFVSSIRFGAALVTFLLFYLIYLVLLLVFVKPWLLALGLMASIFICGIVIFRYYVGFRKTFAKLKVIFWKLTNNDNWLNLKYNWDATVNKMDDFIQL
jgi:1-acyl-sn-glycerol-3-phosphate acyltransferase